MLHIGSPYFYREVASDLERFQYILHEGVTWKRNRRGGPIYDWAASNLGLASQKDALHFPPTSTLVNIDLPNEQFRQGFMRLPLRYKLLIIFFRPLFWFITKLPSARLFLFRSMTIREARKYEKNETEMDSLILGKRDSHICAEIERFEAKNRGQTGKVFVAVVFGARHMISVARCLRGLGYRPTTKRWFEIARFEKIDKAEQKEQEPNKRMQEICRETPNS